MTETTTRTVQTVAEELCRAFERKTRPNGETFVTLKDASPEWMRDVCHEAHGDMLPDDWRYILIEWCADALAEHESEDDARDALEPDVYTSRLTDWLASSLHRHAYCDDAMQEYGIPFDGTLALLQLGQKYEAEEVFGQLLTALTALVEEE